MRLTFYESKVSALIISSAFSIMTAISFFSVFPDKSLSVSMRYSIFHAVAVVFGVIAFISILAALVNFKILVFSKKLRNDGESLLGINSFNPFYAMTDSFLNEDGRNFRVKLIKYIMFFVGSMILSLPCAVMARFILELN